MLFEKSLIFAREKRATFVVLYAFRFLILLWATYPIALAFKLTLSGCNPPCCFKPRTITTMISLDSKHIK